MSEMARACGVSIKTVSDWRQKGLIRAHAINDLPSFSFEDPAQETQSEDFGQERLTIGCLVKNRSWAICHVRTFMLAFMVLA